MKPKVLIVEDEPGIADTLQYALRTEGFEPAWSATGEDALARIAAEVPALVILDVGLPDASGFEIFKRIRATSDVPVVFLTARSDEIDRVVGLELGADDYIAKPFSPRELVARVRSILRRTAKAQGLGPVPAATAPAPTRCVAASAAVGVAAGASGRRRSSGGERRRWPSTKAGCRSAITAACSSSRATSSACCARSPRGPASSSRAMRCSSGSGATTPRAWTGPSTPTSRRVRAKMKAIAPQQEPIRTHRGTGYSLAEDLPSGAGLTQRALTKRNRIFVGVLVAYALGVAFLMYRQLGDIDPRYRESAEESLVETANLMAALIETDSRRRRLRVDGLEPVFRSLYARRFSADIYGVEKTRVELRMTVVDRWGTVVFDSRGAELGADHSQWHDVFLALHGKYGARTTADVEGDPRTSVMYVAVPIREQRGRRGRRHRRRGQRRQAGAELRPVRRGGAEEDAAARRDLGRRGRAAGDDPLGLAGAAVRADRRLRPLCARRSARSACRGSAGARSARSAPPTTRCATRWPAATTSPTTCRR